MPESTKNESVLILKAFLLDTQIEHPEQVVIVIGGKHSFLSELFAVNPNMRQEMIEELAEIYRQLGWEVSR